MSQALAFGPPQRQCTRSRRTATGSPPAAPATSSQARRSAGERGHWRAGRAQAPLHAYTRDDAVLGADDGVGEAHGAVLAAAQHDAVLAQLCYFFMVTGERSEARRGSGAARERSVLGWRTRQQRTDAEQKHAAGAAVRGPRRETGEGWAKGAGERRESERKERAHVAKAAHAPPSLCASLVPDGAGSQQAGGAGETRQSGATQSKEPYRWSRILWSGRRACPTQPLAALRRRCSRSPARVRRGKGVRRESESAPLSIAGRKREERESEKEREQ